jgi:hypothetical protein
MPNIYQTLVVVLYISPLDNTLIHSINTVYKPLPPQTPSFPRRSEQVYLKNQKVILPSLPPSLNAVPMQFTSPRLSPINNHYQSSALIRFARPELVVRARRKRVPPLRLGILRRWRVRSWVLDGGGQLDRGRRVRLEGGLVELRGGEGRGRVLAVVAASSLAFAQFQRFETRGKLTGKAPGAGCTFPFRSSEAGSIRGC